MMESVIKKTKNLCKNIYEEYYKSSIKNRIEHIDFLDDWIYPEIALNKIIFKLFKDVFFKEFKYGVHRKESIYLCLLNNNTFIFVAKYNVEKNTQNIFIDDMIKHYHLESEISYRDKINIKQLNLDFFDSQEYLLNNSETGGNADDSQIFLKDIIISLYGINKKSEQTNKIIENTIKEVKYLQKYKTSELASKDISKFHGVLFKLIIVPNIVELKLSEAEENIIEKYILSCKNSSEILKLLSTLNYTKSLLHNIDRYDYFDLTFITVSAFKAVEIVFVDCLNKKYSNKKIKDERGKEINLGNELLTLGQMYQIFNSKDGEIIEFLNLNSVYSTQVKTIFSNWLQFSRNGFLHKHIIETHDFEQLNNSIKDSIKLMCLLILLFNN